MSPQEAVGAVLRVYAHPDLVTTTGGVSWAVVDRMLVLRGSWTPEDWERDMQALPSLAPMTLSPTDITNFDLPVFAGFWQGITAAAGALAARRTTLRGITGHSLGGVHAQYLHRWLGSVLPLIVFGSPNCSAPDAALPPAAGRGYQNGLDPVPLLPPGQSWLLHRITLWEPPGNPYNFLAWHHATLYARGLGVADVPAAP